MKFSTKGVKSADDIGSGFVQPGFYHVIVTDVDEPIDTEKPIIVDFQVLKGTMPGQEKLGVRNWFPTSQKALPNLQRFALVTGLIKPDEEREVSFKDAIGKHLVIEVIENEYTDKDGVTKKNAKIKWAGYYPIGHPDVANVPIDEEAINITKGGGQLEAGGAGTNDPNTNTAGDDAWENL